MAATLISCGAFVPLAVKWPLYTRRVSRITVKALVASNIIQSVCLVGKGRLKERCGLELRTNFFFRLRNRQNLVWIRFEYGALVELCRAEKTIVYGNKPVPMQICPP